MLEFLRPNSALRKKVPAIYMAAFFMSFYGGLYIVTLPFIITYLGGKDEDLGLCTALGFSSYLVSCIAVGHHLDKFNSRRLVQIGSGMITLSMAAILGIVLLEMHNYNLPRPIWLITIAAMVSGASTSIFWPPLMGWLSTGREGKVLNRTFGIYNMTWSAGLAISPIIGGLLVQSSIISAMIAAVASLAMTFLSVTLANPPAARADVQNNNNNLLPPESANPQLEKFRWVSRIALFTVYTCVGLMKTQLAMLLTQEMHLPKSYFGTLTTVMWLVTCMLFLVATRIHTWHYRILPTILVQVSVLISMLFIIECQFMVAFFVAAVLMGLGQGFIYISHQFYAASQSIKRSGSMAVHEILISGGHITGFLAGGYLAAYVGRQHAPYLFGLCVVLVGLLAQMIVWRRLSGGQKNAHPA
jgi:MFS family permease